MKTITSTNARKNLKSLLEIVKETGEVFAIGRHKHLDALLMKFPKNYNKNLNEITNVNGYSPSFDFLSEEPDLYSVEDLKSRYAS